MQYQYLVEFVQSLLELLRLEQDDRDLPASFDDSLVVRSE